MSISCRAIAASVTTLSILLSGCGSSNTDTTLTTTAPNTGSGGPSITVQPLSMTIVSGSNGVLSVVASGTGVTYQWYQDGTAIAGATSAIYTATAAGTYYVLATAADGAVTSMNALISIASSPVIRTQPVSATILTGTSQTLTVNAEGADLAYQWYLNGSAIPNATHASYAADAAGSYMVVVTNGAGSTSSNAAVLALSASVKAPVINVQPVAQTVNAGTGVTLYVTVIGTSVAYQWYLNDTPIPGATERLYKITSASVRNSGTYKLVATNTAGSATSAAIALSVNVISAGANTAQVVNAANAFLSTLSSAQKTVATSATDATTVLFDYALANAIQWTNLPGDRHGLRLNASTLTAAQLAAANSVIAKAFSATGITLFNELRAADSVLAAVPATTRGGGSTPGGTGMAPLDGMGTPPSGATGIGTGGAPAGLSYGNDLYSIAFVGSPSATGPWILQVAGHHLAYNITYNAGKVSATPNFVGVEPPNWTVASDGNITVTNTAISTGTAHAPMELQRAAVYNLAESLYADSASAAAAKFSGTFTDIIMGASGNSDGNYKSLVYPTSGRGLQYRAMNVSQKAYVRAAIEAWVNTQAADVASNLLGDYLSDAALEGTYVGYAVGQNGTKADFRAYPNAVSSPLEAQHSYIRIDGPRVWIEFVVQQGIVYGTDVHYHTIWRDKTADYGGSF